MGASKRDRLVLGIVTLALFAKRLPDCVVSFCTIKVTFDRALETKTTFRWSRDVVVAHFPHNDPSVVSVAVVNMHPCSV